MTPDISFPNMGIELFSVNRVAISIFGLNLYWYALFIIAGILAGYATAVIEAKRSGQKPDDYSDLLFFSVIAAIIGLRLFFVAFNWEHYRHDPLRIITGIREGGLAIYGGIISSVITVYVFSRVRKLNMWTIFDTCAPSFAIGQAIGRWGNFFNREAFGGFTDNLFAMRIVRDQTRMPLPADILDNTIIYQGIEYIQVHPTFLYESLWSLGVFILLTLYRPHKKFNGEILCLYFLSYGFARFFIESLRVDQLMMGAIPVSQLMSALIFVVAVVAIALQRRQSLLNAK